jgi:hypothetical protein
MRLAVDFVKPFFSPPGDAFALRETLVFSRLNLRSSVFIRGKVRVAGFLHQFVATHHMRIRLMSFVVFKGQ